MPGLLRGAFPLDGNARQTQARLISMKTSREVRVMLPARGAERVLQSTFNLIYPVL